VALARSSQPSAAAPPGPRGSAAAGRSCRASSCSPRLRSRSVGASSIDRELGGRTVSRRVWRIAPPPGRPRAEGWDRRRSGTGRGRWPRAATTQTVGFGSSFRGFVVTSMIAGRWRRVASRGIQAGPGPPGGAECCWLLLLVGAAETQGAFALELLLRLLDPPGRTTVQFQAAFLPARRSPARFQIRTTRRLRGWKRRPLQSGASPARPAYPLAWQARSGNAIGQGASTFRGPVRSIDGVPGGDHQGLHALQGLLKGGAIPAEFSSRNQFAP